jgi:rfaE bifunctional protein nucleotidyltransferase chain/domain
MIDVEFPESYSSVKIMDIAECSSAIARLKASGKKVGLCHGGFDLLHPGHVKHFESAKKLCDRLIVSVTSDRFVSGRKGGGRPVYPDRLRAYMIAGLKDVDYVVITDFKSGADAIKLLKPDYYIKGPDYISKRTPGIALERAAIESAGGKILYTNDPKLATTQIIDYIKQIDCKSILICADRDGTLIMNDDFFGKEKNWRDIVVFNEEVINFLAYLQTKFRTTKIIVSNQAGVARGLFTCERVDEINKHIDRELLDRGIRIDSWDFCKDVDTKYAEKHPELIKNYDCVLEETKRKPSIGMVEDSLKRLGMKLDDYDRIIVLGDRQEDKELSENIGGLFIDVKGMRYDEMVSLVSKTSL